jgi:dynein heavy chain
MDDYTTLNMSAYAGDKQQQYSTIANVSTTKAQEKHINQCPSDTNEKRPLKITDMKLIFMAMLLAVILFISLGAIVLSIISFIASGSQSIKLDATNDGTTSLATTQIKNNISQLGIHLDALDSLAIIEQAQITRLHCGDGVWHQIAHINMSDPSQQCPTAWREYYNDTSNIRVCGRAISTEGSCSSVSLSMTSIGRLYSKVCGRVVGYQFVTPDAFTKYAGNDDIPFDGVNITYGTGHIWSYVASWSENSQSSSCPCSTAAQSTVPSFIGNRYYCESGNPTDTFMKDHLYRNDPLWDGQQCEGTCCTGTNSPPWFKVQLPAPTTDAIEVSICADQSTNDEDTPIELLEIYVQ